MDGLTWAGGGPYEIRVHSMIKAWLHDPASQALNNAASEPGVTLNESQRTGVMNEAGLDSSDELWTTGFYIHVLAPGP